MDQIAQSALRAIVTQMGPAEKAGDAEFFEGLLADNFQFRRANGTLVGKADYLAALVDLQNSYSKLDASGIDIDFYEGVAVATLIVDAAGKRGEQAFAGRFRNIRIFMHQPEGPQWQLHSWFNARIGDS